MGRWRESIDGQLEDILGVDDRAAALLERWLSRVNTLFANHWKNRVPALDPDEWGGIPGYPNERNREAALQKIVDFVKDKYGTKLWVDDFVVDSEAYGDQTIGVKITVPGVDAYESVLAYIHEEGEYVITNWGDEWENWEDEQYQKDPWPKIEHDQPGQTDGVELYTGDFVDYYIFKSGHDYRITSWSNGKPVKVWNPTLDVKAFSLPLGPDGEEPHPNDELFWDIFEQACKDNEAHLQRQTKWWRGLPDFFWKGDGEQGWHDLYHPPDEWFKARREREKKLEEEKQERWRLAEERRKANERQKTSAQLVREPKRERTGVVTYTAREEKRTRARAGMMRRAFLTNTVAHRRVPMQGDLFHRGRGSRGEVTFYRVGDGRPVLTVTDFEIQQGIAHEKVRRVAKTGVVWRAYPGVSHLDWRPVVVNKDQGFHGLTRRRKRRR